jgi:hypothetical protein
MQHHVGRRPSLMSLTRQVALSVRPFTIARNFTEF